MNNMSWKERLQFLCFVLPLCVAVGLMAIWAASELPRLEKGWALKLIENPWQCCK